MGKRARSAQSAMDSDDDSVVLCSPNVELQTPASWLAVLLVRKFAGHIIDVLESKSFHI